MTLTIRDVARRTEPGRYGDGRGLYLQITRAGVKSWLLRYQLDGRERWMGLGPAHTFTLEEARERARRARQLLRDGVDPLDARREERSRQASEAALAAARTVTFRECAEQYFNRHSVRWNNAKHRAQFMSTLRQYAFPHFGKVPVADVDMALVLRAIEPIWTTKPETASRVRGRIESVLDFAKVRGYRTGDNPARWDGWLSHQLPPRNQIARVRHHPALPYADMPAFMEQLRGRVGIAARALEFAILTAARTGEVTGALWDEMDLIAKVWTVPAERMKGRREHRVPLSQRAVDILTAMPREAEYVFPGGHKGEPMSNMAMLTLLRRMRRHDVTVHGFRSTFRDWTAERTAVANHVAEAALAHTVGNKVEAAYRRGDLLAQRARLMVDWAAYCAGPATEGAVVPIRRRGRA